MYIKTKKILSYTWYFIWLIKRFTKTNKGKYKPYILFGTYL